MAGMILKRAGVVLLALLKGMLYAAVFLLKAILGGVKLFLLLFALVARVVLSMVRIATNT